LGEELSNGDFRQRTPEEMAALPLEGVKDAPVVYVDGYQGVTVSNGVVKFNFYQDLLDTTPNKNVRRCNLILSTPLPVIVSIRNALNDLITNLAERGLMVSQETKTTDQKRQ
jgi:hypothetical protein